MNKSLKGRRIRRLERGFTLVEMSIVLVVIGLILGAVSIGTGLQRDAEHNKIKQKFVDQWVQAYNSYYQRAGVVLGDSQTEPRLMVNGANFAGAADGRLSGGDMRTVDAPAAICQGSAGQRMSRPYAAGTDPSLHTLMDNLGIGMPPGRSEGREDRYLYLDSNGNPQEVQVCFQWNNPGTDSGSGNVMVISGLTPDLARTLDQMIDGRADAREGLFRQERVGGDTSGQAGVQWAGNNAQDISVGFADGDETGGANLDEDQVIVLVAHYKMNQ